MYGKEKAACKHFKYLMSVLLPVWQGLFKIAERNLGAEIFTPSRIGHVAASGVCEGINTSEQLASSYRKEHFSRQHDLKHAWRLLWKNYRIKMSCILRIFVSVKKKKNDSTLLWKKRLPFKNPHKFFQSWSADKFHILRVPIRHAI